MTDQFPTDWAAAWQAQVVAEHAQFDAITDPQARHGPDWWAAHAARFRSSAQRTPQPDAFLAQVLPFVRPGTRVLDVGAGTGRYFQPLVEAGALVTAVEPSAGMSQYLEQAGLETVLPVQII